MNEAKITELPPITVERLMGGAIPPRKILIPDDEQGVIGMYYGLGRAPLVPYLRETEYYSDYIVCGPPLDGWEINALLYLVAPHKVKTYGFDTADIVGDWDLLFNPRDEAGKKRLKNHQNMPGWRQYSRNRELLQRPLTNALAKINSHQDPHDRSDLYIPVMRWRDNRWVFDLHKNQSAAYLAQNFQSGQFEPRKFNSLLGLMYLATYAPEITEGWPEYMNYAGQGSPELKDGFREIGPTQILPVAVRKLNDILLARLKHQIELYCQGAPTAFIAATE